SLAARIDGSGFKKRQLERISIEPRSIVRHLRVDRQLLVRGVKLDGGRRGLHCNALLERSGSQRRVYRDVAARLNRDVLLSKFPEAGGFDADGIASRIDEIEDINTRAVRRFD